MVKVYDMVTYGFYEPDEAATPNSMDITAVSHRNSTAALQLQLLQTPSTTRTETFPPSLRDIDIDCFLDGNSA